MLHAVCGCLSQKYAVRPTVLGQRWRPQPIAPGPNGLFMDVIHLERPFDDPEFNIDLWATADEEQLDLARRASLEQHGFRVALLGGHVPPILKQLFTEEELGQMNGEHLQIQSGVPTRIETSGMHAAWPADSQLMDGDAATYANAVGMLRVVPRITTDGCIDLVITPEIQHGDARRQFVPTIGAAGPLDWSIQVGRQSRLYEDLSFTVRLRPGQFAIIGCLAGDRESLGARFFTRIKDGQTVQRVILLEAEPSHEALAARADRR